MIQGDKRERQERQAQPELVKKVGLFEGRVIAINPTAEEFKEVLEIDLPEESKVTEYLGTSRDGNTFLRVDIWLEEVKKKDKFKVTFFLEDKERENRDGTKKQYINNIGKCAWADDPNNLADWFAKRDYRVAYVGEEEMYEFLRTWLGELDYAKESTVLQLEWKRLMKGNLKDLKDQVNGAYCTNVVALATVTVRQKDGENKEYQSIYNKAFLPAYYLKNFRLINYNDSSVLNALRNKKPKELKPHERFVVNVTGEYGCKDYYILRDLQEYNPDDNLVATDKALSDDGSDY
jgi:hypothetical protein